MSNALGKRSALAVVGSLLVACGAAPPANEASEATASTSEALPKQCTDGDCPTPPPKPQPPANVCTFNPLTTPAPTSPSYPLQFGTSPWYETPHNYASACVSNTSSDPLVVVQRRLMIQYKCSGPVTWWVFMRDGSNAEMEMQLCQYTNDLSDYIYDLAVAPMLPGSIDPAYSSWGFSDAWIPKPPPGWMWVIPWECPVCPGSGCMFPVEDGHTKI